MSNLWSVVPRLGRAALTILLVTLGACSTASVEVICDGLACSEEQWQAVFERSVDDLYQEGIEITPESYDDPVQLEWLRARMIGRVFAARVEGSRTSKVV